MFPRTPKRSDHRSLLAFGQPFSPDEGSEVSDRGIGRFGVVAVLYQFAVQIHPIPQGGTGSTCSPRVGAMTLFPHYFSEEVVP